MTGLPLSESGTHTLDLFAGPGGWDWAATRLGLDPLGIEWDNAACATRAAAGLRTMQADVAELNPMDFAPCDVLIASPPCQAWSMAGKGGGQRDKEHVIACALEIAAGSDTRATHREQCEDKRSLLVVEPLRWTLALRPEWIAFEQVPPVLELWTMFAEVLRSEGYSVWAGVLEAERYGVPQTRERAILMASRSTTIHPPAPTHQRYVKGESQRHDVTFDGEILPWVSMAEALGWTEGRSPRPAPMVTSGGTAQGGVEVFASKAAREAVRLSVAYDRRQGTTNPETGVRTMARPIPVTEPAPTIAAEGLAKGRDVWVQRERSGDRAEEGFDPQQEPCQTLTSKARSWTVMEKKEDRPERKAQGAGNTPRREDEPAATLDTRTDLAKWTEQRPSPTLVTTRRSDEGLIAGRQLPAGEGRNVGGHGWDSSPTGSGDAVRVTVQEASILQTFPPDYPWQGARTKQFEQIGNAVPPMLAAAVLRALLPLDEIQEMAA